MLCAPSEARVQLCASFLFRHLMSKSRLGRGEIVPLFKVEVFKSANGEEWGNVWYVNAADMDAANTAAAVIIDAEEDITGSLVTFTSARVSTAQPNDNVFTTIPINSTGHVEITGNYLPLWDTIRVDFPAASGRPGRKYIRGALGTEHLSGNFGQLDAGKVTDAAGVFNALISNLASASPLVQPDGDAYVSAAPASHVQMRQLHRKRRAAATP